jgi:hypothetical protein
LSWNNSGGSATREGAQGHARGAARGRRQGGARRGAAGEPSGGVERRGAAGGAPPGATREGGARRGATKGRQGCEQRGRAGEEEGEGEGKRERERERGGELTSGANSGDHHFQNLGHHGEREMGERGRLLHGRIEMRERDQGGARAELGWVGLGWGAPRVKTPWHAQPQIGNQFAKQNSK